MSTLSVTTVTSANGATDLTIRTGNTSGPALIVGAGGKLTINNISTYANNSAAVSGGLSTGNIYKTSNGEIRIVV